MFRKIGLVVHPGKREATDMAGRTAAFFREHGISTVSLQQNSDGARDADLILVMRDGDIVEQGTHSELLGSNEVYRRMWEAHTGSKGGAA